jgi:hypothetical protein
VPNKEAETEADSKYRKQNRQEASPKTSRGNLSLIEGTHHRRRNDVARDTPVCSEGSKHVRGIVSQNKRRFNQ